jgi:hypothetical protein
MRSGQFGDQKIFGSLEKPLEIADYVFCPHKKITARTIRISGALTINLFLLFLTHLLYVYLFIFFFILITLFLLEYQRDTDQCAPLQPTHQIGEKQSNL